MTDQRSLFGDFEFPRTHGLDYLLNEERPVTDYLFVNDPREKFSIYVEDGFPIFKVPESRERPYFLFELNSPGRMIKFFCPEKHEHLDTAVWYFYVEVLDENGAAHGLPGQVRVGMRDFRFELAKGKPKFIEVLENVTLNTSAVTA